MSRNAQRLLDEARRLPADEFNWLIGEMLQHEGDPANEQISASEVDAAWGEEIKRRLDEIDSGKVEMIPGEVVLAEMEARRRELLKQIAE